MVADVILITQTCTPTAENVCTKETVETEEIEYEKLCKEVVDTICDAPHAYHGLHKREAEADAEADPHYGGYVAHRYHNYRTKLNARYFHLYYEQKEYDYEINPITCGSDMWTHVMIS